MSMEDRIGVAQGREIPLQAVRVSGEVLGWFGRYRVEQSFANVGKEPIEAIYTFPLSEKAAVCEFKAVIGDRTVRTEVQAKQEAYKKYEQAVQKGDGAYLLEQHRDNIFQISLGQIPPGVSVRAEIGYLEALAMQDGELRLTIPTVVAPRYIPGQRQGTKRGMGTADPTDQVPDADFITPLVGLAPYTLEVDLSIRLPLPMETITSPLHPIRVENLPDGVSRVSLSGEKLDRDLVVVCVLAAEAESGGAAWDGSEGGRLMVNLVPNLAGGKSEPRDYVFLLDISGSMMGEKIEQAKAAVNLCLRQLGEGDRFNIAAFESSTHCLDEHRTLDFNQANLDRATKWVNKLHSMGGTELLPALHLALAWGKDREKVVFVFTDGQVGNEAEIVRLVRANRDRCRFFPFGIDTAVNKGFLTDLAAAGKGLAEFIYPGERIEEKVVRQFARVASPQVSGLKVRWEGIAVTESLPAQVPALYDQEATAFLASFKGARQGWLSLSGTVNGAAWEQRVDLSALMPLADGELLSLWMAKQKQEALEEGLSTSYGNGRRQEAVQQEIVALSQQTGLLSSQTSMVGVEERPDPVSGLPRTVVVPVSPPAGWGMYDVDAFDCNITLSADARPIASVIQANLGGAVSFMPRLAMPAFLRRPGFKADSGDENFMMDDPAVHETPAADAGAELRALALQQAADGSFPGDDPVAATAKAALRFSLAGGAFDLYRRPVQRAAAFLISRKQLTTLVMLALKAVELRDKKMKWPQIAVELVKALAAMLNDTSVQAAAAQILAEVPEADAGRVQALRQALGLAEKAE